jgi:SAM-dependent methyltransferase
MPLTFLSTDYYTDDNTFDSIFPAHIQDLSRVHWTPLAVAKIAASFLASFEGVKIVDIGSGIGKFCLAGANYYPGAEFYGIEQRKDLVEYAMVAKEKHGVENAHFIHGNLLHQSLENYDNVYFYNSFCENLRSSASIDHTIELSPKLYVLYTTHLRKLLNDKPKGTRLVTYHSLNAEIPSSYEMVASYMGKTLKMWIKK